MKIFFIQDKIDGLVARMRDKRNAYNILGGKPEGKRPLGRPWRRWEDNIKMDLRVGGLNWNHLARDRDQWRTLLNTVKNIGVT
jgi:hypothetical protein